MNLDTLVLPLQVSSSAFNSALKVATAGVAAAVAAMGLAIKATFDWANDLDKLGDVMGGTNTELAALNFVARKSGVSVDALAKGTVILSKGLVDAKGKLDTTGKALKEWGVNVFDANGALKDQTTLMGDIAQKYGEFSTQQEKVNFLTEVFGRSGAELVDFFDTLAAEGGIDAVTKKVEAFGLAIDPNRYEQFNRSLEELKLIGLGLAVGFTEKVMPALEKFLGWFSDFAQDPSFKKLAKNFDTFVGGVVQGMADSINEWASGSGPQELSDTLVSWIEKIGTGDAVESKTLTAVQNVFDALVRAFGEIDWSAIDAALDVWDAKILESFDQMDADILAKFDEWDAALLTKYDELDAAILVKLDELDVAANAIFLRMLASIAATNATRMAEIQTGFATWTTNLGTIITTGLTKLDLAFVTWSIKVMNTIRTWGTDLIASANASMETLKGNMDSKINAITEKFVTRFSSIPRKAAEGFNASKQILIDVVSSVVDAINAILKKIKTSFGLTFTGVNWNSGGSTGNVDTIGGGGGKDDEYTPQGMAFGGAPAMQSGGGTMDLSNGTIDRLSERLSLDLSTAIVRASNSV